METYETKRTHNLTMLEYLSLRWKKVTWITCTDQPQWYTLPLPTLKLATAAWRLICAWAERKRQNNVAVEAFSCCRTKHNHKLKNRKKKINKWTALSFAWSACLFFHNVIITYSLCQTVRTNCSYVHASGKRPSPTAAFALPFRFAHLDHCLCLN